MAYASLYDTHVTELRFKCLEWSVYLNSLNRNIEFQIYEDKENMKIDFEIVLRNSQGVNINSFLVNDIHVSQDLSKHNEACDQHSPAPIWFTSEYIFPIWEICYLVTP